MTVTVSVVAVVVRLIDFQRIGFDRAAVGFHFETFLMGRDMHVVVLRTVVVTVLLLRTVFVVVRVIVGRATSTRS